MGICVVLRPPRKSGRAAGDLRRHASGGDFCAPIKGRPKRCATSGAACVQAGLRHAEERQGPRGGYLNRDVSVVEGMASAGAGYESRSFYFPEREFGYAVVSRQSLAPYDEAEAEQDWLRLGDVPGPSENQRQSIEKSGG